MTGGDAARRRRISADAGRVGAAFVVIAVAGCAQEDLVSAAPYCALAAPCPSDEHCEVIAYPTSEVTCDDGRCVLEYMCRTDDDCDGDTVCRFTSTFAEGVGLFSCVRECVADEDCAPAEHCLGNGRCAAPENACAMDVRRHTAAPRSSPTATSAFRGVSRTATAWKVTSFAGNRLDCA
jgi:hypothetical protein